MRLRHWVKVPAKGRAIWEQNLGSSQKMGCDARRKQDIVKRKQQKKENQT
jgi:hypothetical protein